MGEIYIFKNNQIGKMTGESKKITTETKQFNREEYYKQLQDAFNGKDKKLISNDEKKKNATVMQFMLDTCSHINMFCGKASVFRNHFYDDGDDKLQELKQITIQSLNNFLGQEGKKIVIIMKDGDNVDDFLIDNVKEFIESGKIVFFNLPKDFAKVCFINHFTTADESTMRFEIDEEGHTAICAFNDKTSTTNFNDTFSLLRSYASMLAI